MSSLKGLTLQNRGALVAAIEQKIERRQKRHELTVLLWINGMMIVLPLHDNTVTREEIDFQIVLRRVSAQVAVGAKVATEVQQTFGLVAGDFQFGGPMHSGL